MRNARRTIDAGFTTVRDVGTFRAFADVSLKRAIKEGYIVGPRMHCAGGYITTTEGGGEVTGFAADVQLPGPCASESQTQPAKYVVQCGGSWRTVATSSR